ncbi:MAG TPA: hypothetical protein VFE16_12000 [Candidatus Cybelea sp.]|nr:hypothetical protein [Candidatus Cybelea sp.]
MRVGFEILELARAAGARKIFVVGIGREVGKTTVLRAVYAAAHATGVRTALASMNPKHRLWLRPQTLFVTARGLLPRSPAAQIVKLSPLQSPTGALLYARSISSGSYELAGAPAASGVREVVTTLAGFSEIVIVDGAVDRVAALAGSDGAIVVACGAGGAGTMQEAVDDAAALVARLRVPQVDPTAPAIDVTGALTAAHAATFLAARETRQIVVRDPTQIALSGRGGTRSLSQLRIRCRRPLRVIAATVASIGTERSFEPGPFLTAVAEATGLPTFDVYAGVRAA